MRFAYNLAVIASMLGFNAVFSAYEMALASVSHARLVVLRQKGGRGAAAALAMKDRMEASLAVLQLGITLCGAVAAATGGAGVDDAITPWLRLRYGLSLPWAQAAALTIFVVPLSAATIVFAELVPKMIALQNKEAICLALSPAMIWLWRLTYPLVYLLEKSVKAALRVRRRRGKDGPGADETSLHEMTAAAALARTARLIGAREEKIVLSAAQLAIRKVNEIMLGASDISMIPLSLTLPEALVRAHLDMHTRFPVSTKDGDPQSIKGYITFKDLIAVLKSNPQGGGLKDIVRPIKRVGEDLPLSKALDQMVHEKVHISLVESAEGRVLGMITLEDIIEELVGDIEDEFGRLPAHVHPSGAGWIMGGGVPMNVAASIARIPWNDPDGRSLTLSDWASQALGRPVERGEIFTARGLRVVVRKVRRRRLSEASVSAEKSEPAKP